MILTHSMNSVPHRILLFFTCILLLTPVGWGCRDKCKRTVCVNGTCMDGVCQCSTGYFHEDCNTIINVGYSGTWSLTEDCTAGTDLYTVGISPVAGSKTTLTLVGLWEQADDTVTAEVAANGMDITVTRQALGSVEVAAEGQANHEQDEITLSYRIYGTGQSQPFDQCTAALQKN